MVPNSTLTGTSASLKPVLQSFKGSGEKLLPGTSEPRLRAQAGKKRFKKANG